MTVKQDRPAPLRQTVIAVFRVRAGQVGSYRDYLNPLPLLAVLGTASRT